MRREEERQYLFDTSLNHVRKQGRPSGYSKGPGSFVCEYRAGDGAQCAAGPFIRNYDSRMEGKGFCTLVEEFPNAVDPVAVEQRSLVYALQCCHDFAARCSNSDFKQAYEQRMERLASRYGLTYLPA